MHTTINKNTPPNFSTLKAGHPDLILQLAMEARQDKDGINLVAGVPMTADGKTLVFECMKEAAKALPIDNSYGPITGLPDLIQSSEQDIFGKDSNRLKSGHIASVITAGGTMALFTAGRILKKSNYADSSLFMPELTWDNHPTIYKNLNFDVKQEVTYQRSKDGTLDFNLFIDSVKKIPAHSILLIEGNGNNPGAYDMTLEQTIELGKVCLANDLMLIYDFAYQQLGQGYEEDSAPIRALTDQVGLNFIVSYSFSKRYGTFGQRAGMISVVTSNKDEAQVVKSNLMESNRSSLSNPPRYSQELILWVKNNRASEHFTEVETLRQRSVSERNLFISGLAKNGHDYSYMKNDSGMFIFLNDISADEASILKTKYHLHGVPWRGAKGQHQGLRLNALGIGEHNRERIIDAISNVKNKI
jgi:aromatic-amino-acid transaminase